MGPREWATTSRLGVRAALKLTARLRLPSESAKETSFARVGVLSPCAQRFKAGRSIDLAPPLWWLARRVTRSSRGRAVGDMGRTDVIGPPTRSPEEADGASICRADPQVRDVEVVGGARLRAPQWGTGWSPSSQSGAIGMELAVARARIDRTVDHSRTRAHLVGRGRSPER